MGENRNSSRVLVGKPKEIDCLLDLAFMKLQFKLALGNMVWFNLPALGCCGHLTS